MFKKISVMIAMVAVSAVAMAGVKDFRSGYYFDVVKKDAFLAKTNKDLVTKATKDKDYYKVVTSGPTDEATVWFSGQETTYVYNICQAHDCGGNYMVTLYTPAAKNVRGFLLKDCTLYKTFGSVTMNDQASVAEMLGADPMLKNVCN